MFSCSYEVECLFSRRVWLFSQSIDIYRKKYANLYLRKRLGIFVSFCLLRFQVRQTRQMMAQIKRQVDRHHAFSRPRKTHTVLRIVTIDSVSAHPTWSDRHQLVSSRKQSLTTTNNIPTTIITFTPQIITTSISRTNAAQKVHQRQQHHAQHSHLYSRHRHTPNRNDLRHCNMPAAVSVHFTSRYRNINRRMARLK